MMHRLDQDFRGCEVERLRGRRTVIFKISDLPRLLSRKLEAAIGFEPMNEGFADLCLSHLATPPHNSYELGVLSWELLKDIRVGSDELEIYLRTPNSVL
jgi:hypothetical protein